MPNKTFFENCIQYTPAAVPHYVKSKYKKTQNNQQHRIHHQQKTTPTTTIAKIVSWHKSKSS